MKRNSHSYTYPVNFDKLADDVVKAGIDVAPTRLDWERLALCLAAIDGENARDAFHKMAAVWPDYARRDSELCYNRAVKKAQNGFTVSVNWLAARLKTHRIDVFNARYRKGFKPLAVTSKGKTSKAKRKGMEIDLEYFFSTQRRDRSILGRCALTDVIVNLWPQGKVLEVLDNYLVGYLAFPNNSVNDAIIFWQVDENKKVVNGKKIYYKRDAHRNKKYAPLVMFPGNPQCLFGQHLLNSDTEKPVAIVESEKSAIIMAIESSEFLWMACGSMQNFNRAMLAPLKSRKVVAFPDLDNKRSRQGLSVSLAMWQEKADELNREGFSIKVDMSLEKAATMPQRIEKWDIADVAMEKAKERFIKNNTKK